MTSSFLHFKRYSLSCLVISWVGSICSSRYVVLSFKWVYASSRYWEVSSITALSPLSAGAMTNSGSFSRCWRLPLSSEDILGGTSMGRHRCRSYSIALRVLFRILCALLGIWYLYFSMYECLRLCKSPIKLLLCVGWGWVGMKDRPLLSRETACLGSFLLERFATFPQSRWGDVDFLSGFDGTCLVFSEGCWYLLVQGYIHVYMGVVYVVSVCPNLATLVGCTCVVSGIYMYVGGVSSLVYEDSDSDMLESPASASILLGE